MASSSGYAVRVEVFEGPLDLLLQLIEHNELDVCAVSLAQVVDQYLEHLERLEGQRDVDEMAGFLSVAARLVLIKSRALLPPPPEELDSWAEEEDDAEELTRQLLEYRRYKELMAELKERQEAGLRSFARQPLPLPEPGQLPLAPVPLERMVRRVRLRLQELARRQEIPVRPHALRMQDVMARIEAELAARGTVSFLALIEECASRVEVIVSFLAVLEMLRRGLVEARQEGLFDDIMLEPVAGAAGGTDE